MLEGFVTILTRGRVCALHVLLLLTMLAAASTAEAHGLIGKRFLPATLAIDDPFVADELSLPTVSHFKTPAAGDSPATWETDVSAEFSKRLSPNLGLSLGGTWKHLDPDEGTSLSGFDNMEVSLKYVFFQSPEHETLISAGLGWDVGGTGSKKVDAESFDTVTPQLFFGKGFGDLPDALDFAKPLAVTGAFGIAIPTRRHTQTITTTTSVDPDTGDVTTDTDVERELNPKVLHWGFTVQYSLQYLQSFVKDVGLPWPFNRMIPLVEFAMQTPVEGRDSGRTTGTINPGLIWFGRYVQVGFELQVPVNERTGKNIGFLGQLHFYLDDIAPQVFTWTPFHGVLGPTQPR
jgi:hypothetical protein